LKPIEAGGQYFRKSRCPAPPRLQQTLHWQTVSLIVLLESVEHQQIHSDGGVHVFDIQGGIQTIYMLSVGDVKDRRGPGMLYKGYTPRNM